MNNKMKKLNSYIVLRIYISYILLLYCALFANETDWGIRIVDTNFFAYFHASPFSLIDANILCARFLLESQSIVSLSAFVNSLNKSSW